MPENPPGFCSICGKKLLPEEKYACVWVTHEGKLFAAFAHIECTEGMEDVTNDLVEGKQK